MRPRARRWHLPELDRGVDRPGDDDRGGPRPFGEVLDQVLRERVDLILGHRHLKIEHHADDGVPTLGRVTDAHAVDVVAGAAETDEGLLAGAVGEIRGRLLGAAGAAANAAIAAKTDGRCDGTNGRFGMASP